MRAFITSCAAPNAKTWPLDYTDAGCDCVDLRSTFQAAYNEPDSSRAALAALKYLHAFLESLTPDARARAKFRESQRKAAAGVAGLLTKEDKDNAHLDKVPRRWIAWRNKPDRHRVLRAFSGFDGAPTCVEHVQDKLYAMGMEDGSSMLVVRCL